MLRKLEHFAEEPFGGLRASFRAEHKVNRLAWNPPRGRGNTISL
jgi:hypothetical protein